MPARFGVLVVGDVIGRAGRTALKRRLPKLREAYAPTFVLANAENAAGGVGMTEDVGREMFGLVDVLTSGNHIWDRKEGIPYLEREPRLLRPANYPPGNPGRGSCVIEAAEGITLAVLNLQGRVFMEAIDCPFRTAEAEVARLRERTPCIVVDIHAEATSEKMALGWFLDGKVSAVFGTHTHVPTADERILPAGTAYITDVGMVGARDSVIGIRRDQAIEKFLLARPVRFEPEKGGLFLSCVFIEIEAATGRALSIVREVIVEDAASD
jgi:metallophosphoesterase (TIGR00282 family)